VTGAHQTELLWLSTFDHERVGHGQRLLVGVDFMAHEQIRMAKARTATSLMKSMASLSF
jgi:hypothetical protein